MSPLKPSNETNSAVSGYGQSSLTRPSASTGTGPAQSTAQDQQVGSGGSGGGVARRATAPVCSRGRLSPFDSLARHRAVSEVTAAPCRVRACCRSGSVVDAAPLRMRLCCRRLCCGCGSVVVASRCGFRVWLSLKAGREKRVFQSRRRRYDRLLRDMCNLSRRQAGRLHSPRSPSFPAAARARSPTSKRMRCRFCTHSK